MQKCEGFFIPKNNSCKFEINKYIFVAFANGLLIEINGGVHFTVCAPFILKDYI